MSEDIHKWTDGRYVLMFDEHTFFVWDNENDERMTALEVTKKLNEQQEFIEELQVSDEMGWKRAKYFEKKCPKELHNKKMYIKRLEYKVQKFKEMNSEQQATIRRLQDLCGKSDGENAKLRIENKKLKAQLREKEEDEKLYANEILELRETNKEHIKFKSLGGNY